MIAEDDKRIDQIFAQIIRLANADFQIQEAISEKGDELDSIIMGLNLLGEELESYTFKLKYSEEKLNSALDQLKTAQHLSHIGSWEWDIASDTMVWTDELYRILGCSKDEYDTSFDSYLACVHPDDRSCVDDVIKTAFQNKNAFSFSHRVIHDDGSECVLDCHGDIYLNDDGSIKRMTGTAQDVTELKKSEQRIMALAAIVESSSDAIISKTIEGYIISWNKQAERIFGYDETEILGKHISTLFPASRLEEEEEILRQIKSNKSLINYETERKRKNGEVFSVAATISPIKNPGGKIIGISNIIRDITSRKKAEEKLLAYTKALEQKNQETEQFAYIASHDLQEPLRTITNYIGLLREDYKGKHDERADIYLDFIAGAARRMQVLIRDLLEYTRIDNESEETEVDCGKLVQDILEDMAAAIKDTDASIEFRDLPVVTGYPTRLKSLFQNLISNALKFRKPGISPLVQIFATDEGRHWKFEIRDNGIGIEKIYFEKIFKLFQRLHGRREYEGTGIGLAQCKKIVEMRGGTMWVTSEPNIGSSFYFTIPKTKLL